MPVPKASMNLDDLVALGKYEIGCSGKISAMKSKSCTERMRDAADHHLGPRVPIPDFAHVRAALFSSEMVNHLYRTRECSVYLATGWLPT